MTIAKRLYIGFGFLLSLMIAITLIGIYKVDLMDSVLTSINDIDSRKQRFAINFRGSVHDRAIALRDTILVLTPEAFRQHTNEILRLD